MNRISNFCLATWVVFVWFAVPTVAFDEQDTKSIDAYIAHQARQERGSEYKQTREVASGDVHPGAPEIVVLYTIEGQNGTNRNLQYLAVFARRNGKLVAAARAEVGGKGQRYVHLKTIEGNTIHLETLDYGPKDAACCPNEKGQTSYVFAGNSLREQKIRPEPRN